MLPMKIGLLMLLSLVASGLAVTTAELDETPSASRITAFYESAAVKTVSFDVTQGQSGYTSFMGQVLYREVLQTTTARVQGRPRLGKQKLSTQPDTWIHSVLRAGPMTATLAVRSDNMYIAGFKAQDGAWHGFKGSSLPGATPLSFGGDYKSLTGGRSTYQDMIKVAVGRSATLAAVSTLARYKVGGPVSEDEVRQALATMVLTFCEALRFTVVRNNVTTAWDNGGHVSIVGIQLLVKWSDVSCALIGYDDQKIKNWSKIPETKGIAKAGDPMMKDASAAAQNIIFVLLPTTCDPIIP